jgi:hypothetical protein
MKKLIPIIILAAIICSGSQATANIQSVPAVTFDEPEMTIYQIASALTGCPERILRGIAFAESTYRADAVGDDGISIGLCQINETYHAERALKYGEYNPWCPLDSLVIAGRLYVDNLSALGSERLAITAHKMGRTGAQAGEVTWYVERVLGV